MICCAFCGESCDCAERQIDVLYISPEKFRRKPQVGTPTVGTWGTLAGFLSRPTVGEAKDIAGGYSPARYVGNVRHKDDLERIWALVVDVDENGHVDTVAEIVSNYSAIVHSTFSSTDDAPRCRLLLELSEPVDVPTYETVHRVVRTRLGTAGIVADQGAKDASRLSYSPVVRPGARYYFRRTEGRTLDARALLAAQPPPAPPKIARVVLPQHRGRYTQAALRKAVDEIARAPVGDRHHTLNSQVYSLARLELTETEIAEAIAPAAVATMGEARRREVERTIHNAFEARRKGAA